MCVHLYVCGVCQGAEVTSVQVRLAGFESRIKAARSGGAGVGAGAAAGRV